MSVRMHVTPNGTSRTRGRFAAGALVAAFVAAAASPAPAAAQRDGALRTSLELRPVIGAFIPTGREHRDFAKDAFLLGGQASWAFSSNLAVTGNFAWAPSETRPSFFEPRERRLNVYQYDVGIEGRMDKSWRGLGGFGGLGIGGRSYQLRRNLGRDETQSHFDGYFALGGDYSLGRTALRIEGRDYISRFRPFDGRERRTRNDVTLSAGLTFRM